MDIKERNIIIGVVTFFIGFITIISIVPLLISFISYNSHRNIFINYQSYFYLDLAVLAITLFLFSYFIIKPIETLKGKKILTLVTMIFGGVLVVFPLIGLGFLLPNFSDCYFEGPFIYFIIVVILFLVLLIPGIILLNHGWYLRKNLRIENNS